MTPSRRQEFFDLVYDAAEDRLLPDRSARLEELLSADSSLQRQYVDFMLVVGGLHRIRGEGDTGFGDLEICRFGDFGIGDPGFGVRDSGFGVRDFDVPNLQISKSTNQQIPPLSTTHYPLPTNFVGGPVFSYIAATLILGVMLLSAWAYTITHDCGPSLASNSRRLTTAGESAPQPPAPVFVARVTGMKDCRWSDPKTEAYAGAYVPLGRKYALSSGLMEITYLSGAKVILEGPCSYKVESTAGGFMALGKLTAKVESENQRPKPQAPSPKTEISKSPNHQISKFTVRTPTAVVTDLGTEFGVKVAANGDTTSHVFQGRVVVHSLAAASTRREPASKNQKSEIRNQKSVTLAAGQSARVEKDAATGDPRIVTGGEASTPPQFVRRIYEPPKLLDLLDIVSGGNGLGNRRERGIDPGSGNEDTHYVAASRWSYGRYRPVHWNRFIDGVFIPDGRHGPVLLDSARNQFDGFPRTNGKAYGSIWARSLKAVPAGREDDAYFQSWIFAMPDAGQFTPEDRGLLGIAPNAGITFDLAAMHKMYGGVYPGRFRAVAGLGDAAAKAPHFSKCEADFWVFVDGRLKWSRSGLQPEDGPTAIDVPLGPSDRFLTIAVTEEEDGGGFDWAVFGDPILEMTPFDKENWKENLPMERNQ